MVGKHLKTPLLLISIAAPLVLSGCQDSHAEVTQSAPPPPGVEVAEVLVETITELDEYTGRLESPQTVSVIPRVSGYVEQVHFEEGTMVQEGDVLFSIDDRVFVAEVARLEAELTSAKASYNQSIKDHQRALKLNKNAISQETVDARFTAKQRGAASVAAIKASLSQAKLDLAFTKVTAPITGKVSSAHITKGNYVSAGDTELTTLVSTAHMYAYFDVDEITFLKYQKLNKLKAGKENTKQLVQLGLANDAGYPKVGHIDFVDNAINQATGTIRVRAVFSNEDQSLWPGMFAKLRITGSSSYEGVLIDNRAVGTDLNKKYVLVLDENNTVQYRPVSLGEKLNGLRIIADGLLPGDKVVINGLQRVRPNMPVTPSEVPMANEMTVSMLREQQDLISQQRQSLVSTALNDKG